MDSYSNQITDYLLTQSWQIAALVAVVAIVNLALRNRSAHVRYLLWLIVLAKCLVPPLLTIPVAVLPQEESAPIPMLERSAAPEVESDSLSSTPLRPALPVRMVEARPVQLSPSQWLGLAWVVGVAVFALVAVAKALRTQLWLRRQRKPLPADLHIGITDVFFGLGVKRFPKVWLVEGIGQPFVWGMLRGGIYLPANFVKVNSAEHRKGILGHELSHFLRFDAAVNLLQTIAQAVFWFHPFVWWANKRIRAEREKCCDEMAIALLNAQVGDYSKALVDSLVTEYESTRPVPSLAVAGPVKNIEERIKTMLIPGKKFYKRPSLITATTVLLAAFLTVPTALVLTARAQTAAPRPQVKTTHPLHEAALAGDIEKVKSLLSKGADVNAQNRNGRTPLHLAAGGKQNDVANLLISKGADINAKDNWNYTPLFDAIFSEDVNMVRLLISKGADVRYRPEKDYPPLHWAVWYESKGMVELLVGHGAKFDVEDPNGWTPLRQAVRQCRRDIVDLFIAEGADISGFYMAACAGKLDRVKELLEQGADVNAKDKFGWTPLYWAASTSRTEVAKFLIYKGADVRIAATNGGTALHQAAGAGDHELVELLLSKGADVNAKTKGGSTPLHGAAWVGSREVVELLIARGAQVNAKKTSGRAPLHTAAYAGNKEVVEVLIAKSADVNTKDKRGWTALDLAKPRGHKEIVDLLRKHGAKD